MLNVLNSTSKDSHVYLTAGFMWKFCLYYKILHVFEGNYL